MFIRIATQPATTCRLANARTRSDSRAFWLAGDEQGCVRVAVCCQGPPQQPAAVSELTLLGTIVTLDGENHPYSLQGPGCIGGVFLHTFKVQPEVTIGLEHVMVVSCAQGKWAEAMAAKRRQLGNSVPDPSRRLTAQSVKKFRISFWIPGIKAAVTREILGSGQVGAGASVTTAASDVTVVDTLPNKLYNTGAVHKVAVLLGDSVAENAGIRNVSIRAECKPSGEVVEFDCPVLKRIEQLLIVKVEIADRLAELLAQSDACDCRLTVAMETGGDAEKTIALGNACDSCNGRARAIAAADIEDSYDYYEVPDCDATEYRRKQPGPPALAPQQLQLVGPTPMAPAAAQLVGPTPMAPAAAQLVGPTPMAPAAAQLAQVQMQPVFYGHFTAPDSQHVPPDQMVAQLLAMDIAAPLLQLPPDEAEADPFLVEPVSSLVDRHSRRDRGSFDEEQFFSLLPDLREPPQLDDATLERLSDLHDIISRDPVSQSQQT